MPFDRQSKIRDVWRHPVGHDVLQGLLQKLGRNEKWVTNPLVGNMRLAALDRLGGEGFADALIEITAIEPERPTRPEPEQHVWWKETVQYQVFVPSFMDADHDGVGDLAGVTQRLPYLERLGVGAIWLWPLLETAEGGVADFTKVMEQLGDAEELQNLVQAAHLRGMYVVAGLDIHATSPRHPWFEDAVQGGEHEEYYFFQKGSPDAQPSNWSLPLGMNTWRWVEERAAWALCIGGPGRIDLNWDNPALRADIAKALGGWIDAGIDGFCFGSVNMVSRGGLENGNPATANLLGLYGFEKFGYGPKLHRYLRELRAKLPKDSPVLLCGEVRGAGTETAKLFTEKGRKELDLILDSGHLVGSPKGKTSEPKIDLQDIKDYYTCWMEEYGADHWMALSLENARTPRMVGRLGANPLYRGILAKMLGTMLLTLRGAPIIYQGEELGISNTRFSSADELRDLVTLRLYKELCERCPEPVALQRALALASDHARTPMPWSAGPKAGFTGAVPWMRLPDGTDFLNAATQMEDPSSVWRFYQRLIALRKKYASLTYGTINIVFKKNKKVFCYFRIGTNDKVYVEMNLTEKEISRPGRILRTQKLILSNYENPARNLRPYEANLYLCE